jgi:hypothetical protein
VADFLVYAPLSNFNWPGESFEFAPGLDVIRKPEQPYPLRGLDEDLAPLDRNHLFWAEHWLRLSWSTGEDPASSELVNLFLISLWLAQPTRAHVKFRFCVNKDPQANEQGGWARLLDQFQWVEGAAVDAVSDQNLTEAATHYPNLLGVRRRGQRLSNALYLTFAGCQAKQWQVALACFAGAAEALLTYETGRGITRRLSRCYASLVSTLPPDRNREYVFFRNLYDKRSDVMHGRGHLIPAADRLPILANFGDALRSAWKAILASPQSLAALESTDAEREEYFQQLKGDWSPPR